MKKGKTKVKAKVKVKGNGSDVNIDLISREMLSSMGGYEKVRFVLDKVKNGKILVLENGLNSLEETQLIETTMGEIDHDKFIGIEMQGYENKDGSIFARLLRKNRTRMEVIGPANLLKTVYKDGNIIQTIILTKGKIVEPK